MDESKADLISPNLVTCVRVGVGDEYNARTHTVTNEGVHVNALFEPLDMKFPMTVAINSFISGRRESDVPEVKM